MTDAQGVIQKNVAGMHAEQSIKSEQVTQAILGGTVSIEEDAGEWLRVRGWDTLPGWIETRWVSRSVPHMARVAEVRSLFADILISPAADSEIITKAVITTTLEMVGECDGFVRIGMPSGEEGWLRHEDARVSSMGEIELPLGPVGSEIIRTARRFLGVPYLWGGTTPFGIDCSGFTQLVYKLNGVSLLRNASMQASDPRAAAVEKADLRPGDLVFFAYGSDKAVVNHVGLAMGHAQFIHSTGGVGVGINRLNEDRYSRDFWGARRMEDGTSWM